MSFETPQNHDQDGIILKSFMSGARHSLSLSGSFKAMAGKDPGGGGVQTSSLSLSGSFKNGRVQVMASRNIRLAPPRAPCTRGRHVS